MGQAELYRKYYYYFLIKYTVFFFLVPSSIQQCTNELCFVNMVINDSVQMLICGALESLCTMWPLEIFPLDLMEDEEIERLVSMKMIVIIIIVRNNNNLSRFFRNR